MKTFILYTLFLPLFSIGQVAVYNIDLRDSTKQQLYSQVENRLVIYTSQNLEQLKLVSVNSGVVYLGEDIFYVYPRKAERDTLKVFSQQRQIYLASFVIDTLSDLVVRVGDYMDTILSIKQVTLNPYLRVQFPGTNYRGNFYVHRFILRIVSKNGDILLQEAGDFSRFSAAQLNVIKRLNRSDELHFAYVTGGGPGSRIRKLPPFSVTIK